MITNLDFGELENSTPVKHRLRLQFLYNFHINIKVKSENVCSL